MIIRYIQYNNLKYMIYCFIFFTLVLLSFYIKFNIQLIAFICIVFISIDLSFGVVAYCKLEKSCKEITHGEFTNINHSSFEDEIVKLTIKRITDEYLLALKNVESDHNEYIDYIQMWIHEVKLSVANLSHLNDETENLKVSYELENISENLERVIAIESSKRIENNIIFERYKLSAICNEAIKMQMNSLMLYEVKVETDYDNSELVVDKYWLTLALKQIINNSIKYGATVIKISTKYKQIIIEDNGVGIDSGEIELVFNKFFCSTKTKETVKSTGIGLYIVKNIIDSFDYTITLESKNNGLKTIIYLSDKEG